MADPWERLAPSLMSTFAGLGPTGVVVDVGAGSGLGTRTLARATTARIVAVEPSLTMRTALLARIIDDPDLCARVSVLARPVPGALDDVLGPIDGFVCAHVLGHLSPTDRWATFATLGARLAPGAVGLVTVATGSPTADGDDGIVVEERHIGDHRYVVRHLSGADGGYRSEYTVLHGDRELRREAFAGTWTPITAEGLAAEVAPLGLDVEAVAPDVVRVAART